MKMHGAIAVTTMVAGTFLAGGAAAQGSKVAPAPAFFDDALEVALPGDGQTKTFNLAGLKTARAAWITFAKYAGGGQAKDVQVMTLMEGVVVKWAVSKETCVYEFRLEASPPAITVSKSPAMCALKPPGNPVFRVLAM